MKTPSFIRLITRTAAVSGLLFATACHKDLSVSDDHNGSSSVHIYLTDDPSLLAEHLFLDIRKLEIKVEDNDSSDDHGRHHGNDDNKTDNSHGSDDGNRHDINDDHSSDTSGGWISVDINAGVYDILRFRNGLDTLFGTGSFPSVRHLRRVRLTLGSNNSAVFDGNTVALDLDDNDRFLVIDIDEDRVEIKSGGRTDFWIDIDGGQSIERHGDRFRLKPRGKAFSKNKNGSIEGIVLPGSARAVVMAINGTDTATAKPEDEGEFKFIGLKAGNYSVVYHATSGSFADQVVSNVIISGREDVHLPTVTLHP